MSRYILLNGKQNIWYTLLSSQFKANRINLIIPFKPIVKRKSYMGVVERNN